MALRIYDTLAREKVDFEPLEPGKVRMYTCGTTSYAPAHIGHARMYVAFDVVYRWLRTRYDVTYVRNYTDVDDKIIKAASEAGEAPDQLAERYIDACDADLTALRCQRPTVEPRVTQHIPEIIALVSLLVDKGYGYAVDGDVYFDVMRFPRYGRLSGRTLKDLEDLEAGARVDVDGRKRSPYDFALWKSAKPGEPSWTSPWGEGRPGWHIECSAMSTKYLGETFDIHAGGKDLVFPHHENEIAQSCAASGAPDLAKIWMHNGFVNLLPQACPKCEAALTGDALPEVCPCGYQFSEDDTKMSKSRGNFYPIHEVIEAYEPEALRLLLMQSHYRSPIQFSHGLIHDAEKRLDKHYETLAAIDAFTYDVTLLPGDPFREVFGTDFDAAFDAAMDDDFNAAKAIAEVLEVFKIANDLIHEREKARLGKALPAAHRSRLLTEARQMIGRYAQVLGLWGQDAATYVARRRAAKSVAVALKPEAIEALIEARTAARAAKDWGRADEIRDELLAKGIVLKDSPTGTTWEAAAG